MYTNVQYNGGREREGEIPFWGFSKLLNIHGGRRDAGDHDGTTHALTTHTMSPHKPKADLGKGKESSSLLSRILSAHLNKTSLHSIINLILQGSFLQGGKRGGNAGFSLNLCISFFFRKTIISWLLPNIDQFPVFRRLRIGNSAGDIISAFFFLFRNCRRLFFCEKSCFWAE